MVHHIFPDIYNRLVELTVNQFYGIYKLQYINKELNDDEEWHSP